jgi:N-acetyl-anhydromuramoyl-L-alanine amidase
MSSAAPSWDGAWLRSVRHLPSPNCSLRPQGTIVDLVIVHSISLPPGVYGGVQIEQLFANTLDWDAHPYFQTIRGIEVSAHFVVRRDGQATQFVSCDERAWHAGTSSWEGRAACNDFSIGIELEGIEGDTFEPAQMRTLAQLLQALRSRYPIAQVVGHEHVSPGRKQDPGTGFDWLALKRRTGWPQRAFPALLSTVPSGRRHTSSTPRGG